MVKSSFYLYFRSSHRLYNTSVVHSFKNVSCTRPEANRWKKNSLNPKNDESKYGYRQFSKQKKNYLEEEKKFHLYIDVLSFLFSRHFPVSPGNRDPSVFQVTLSLYLFYTAY